MESSLISLLKNICGDEVVPKRDISSSSILLSTSTLINSDKLGDMDAEWIVMESEPNSKVNEEGKEYSSRC